jgi:hypothetical protein
MDFVAQVWVFPKFETIYFFYIFLMLAAAFLYVRVMNYLQNKQGKVVNYWGEFHRYARARKCTQAELNILKSFYDTLTEDERELYLLPENRNKLKNALYRYFLNSNENPTEKEVNLFDKLFRSGAEFKKEILSLNDLTIGEVASLEADERGELTYVMQKTNEDLLLSVKGLSPDLLVPGKKVKLYVFRPSSGGYLIGGVVTKSGKNGLIFHYDGTIERKGESHLMLVEKISLTISPWPPEDSNKQNVGLDKNKILLSEENLDKQLDLLRRIAKDQKSNNSKKFDFKETPKPFVARSERLSDRGLLFLLPQSISSEVWKIQDWWEIQFKIPGGTSYSLHGKMMPIKNRQDLYLIRYVAVDEQTTKQLFEDIRNAGGIRESLT